MDSKAVGERPLALMSVRATVPLVVALMTLECPENPERFVRELDRSNGAGWLESPSSRRPPSPGHNRPAWCRCAVVPMENPVSPAVSPQHINAPDEDALGALKGRSDRHVGAVAILPD